MDKVMQMVTDRIIEQLETGTVPWHKPWVAPGYGAFNRISGPDRPYSLMNQMLLKHDGEYASYDQWRKLGGHVRRGEKSETVVFWKWLDPREEKFGEEDPAGRDGEGTEDGKSENRRRPVLRYHPVFHVSQVDGIEPFSAKRQLFNTVPIETAETLFNAYTAGEGIRVERELSDKCYYSPASDGIHLAKTEQYERAEEAAVTAFHEAVHSTGHAKRLNRPGLKNVSFGSAVYSREELVAEIGSSAICVMLGIETDESFRNAAGYIDGWLRMLRAKGNRDAIVRAAAQAEKAVGYILRYHTR